MRLLCVDDEPRVLTLLKELLTLESFDVDTAGNGEEALESIKMNMPDIIITDVRMPKMDGIALLQEVKSAYPEIEVVIVSAHSDIDNAIASLRLGAANFIRKPIDARELLHILSQISEKIRLTRENKNYRENLEKMVEEQTEKLIQSERMAIIGRHSAHLAHNLNSSLTGVLGCIQLLDLKLGERSEKIQSYIDTVQNSALKMRDTIGNTLLRIRKDNSIEKAPIDLNEIIRGQIGMFQTHSDVRNDIYFTTDLAEHIPYIPGIYSDFTQIFDNLISNAIYAMKESEEKTITLKTLFDEHTVTFKVSDTGTGIPDSVKAKIFNPHFTTKPVGKGTGIGLASVQELLQNYNATIDVQSKENKGTTFIVSVPRK